MQLYEKYRPTRWDDFLGQDKVAKRVRAVIERPGFGDGGGDAFWISGPTGTGKTTLAKLIARELDCPSWGYIELDGAKCSVEEVRTLDDCAQVGSLWADRWRVFIVNESHAMTSRAVQAWLTLLERLPARWLVMFTTTQPADADLFGDFTEPLLSRCKVFTLTAQGLAKVFAERAREIALAEGLDGKAPAAYLRLVQEKHNNMRAVLQAIGSAEMLA